jgi:hypothetical protein
MKPAKLMKTFFNAVAGHAVGEAKHHSLMTEYWADDTPQFASHQNCADSWTALSNTCGELAEECLKAENGDGELEKLFDVVPSRVSVIAPDAPAKTFRAVPRFGAPPMPTVAPDAIFEKIFGDFGDGTGD